MSPRTEPLFDLPEPRRSAVARAPWVLAAADPERRRHHIEDQLGPWVTWLVRTYRLRTVIPPCWYRHPDIVERLKNLMAGWIATFTDDPGDHLTDRPFAYVEFDDALERELHRITIPPACLDGDHEDPPTTWSTDTGQPGWLTSSDWATANPAHPAPEFVDTSPPDAGRSVGDRTEHTMAHSPTPTRSVCPGDLVMSRAKGDDLVKDGLAEAMRDYAIFYDGAWWLGDQQTYVRVTDPGFNRKLDFKALKLARADQAVTRTQQPADQAGADADGDGEHQEAEQNLRHDRPPATQPYDRPDDPGEESS